MTNMDTSAKALAALLVGSLAPACVTPRETVDIDESGVFTASLRGLMPLEGEEVRRGLRLGNPDLGEGAFVSGIEFGLAYFSDEASQELGPGDVLQLDDMPFTGPGEVDYDYDVWSLTTAWRAGKAFPLTPSSGIAVEGLLGLSFHSIDLEAGFGGASDSESIASLGPMIGLQLTWYTPARLQLFGRFTGSIEVASNYEEPQSVVLEAGLAYSLSEHVDLVAGFREWRYDADGTTSLTSDIDLEVSGPFLSLGFVF